MGPGQGRKAGLAPDRGTGDGHDPGPGIGGGPGRGEGGEAKGQGPDPVPAHVPEAAIARAVADEAGAVPTPPLVRGLDPGPGQGVRGPGTVNEIDEGVGAGAEAVTGGAGPARKAPGEGGPRPIQVEAQDLILDPGREVAQGTEIPISEQPEPIAGHMDQELNWIF